MCTWMLAVRSHYLYNVMLCVHLATDAYNFTRVMLISYVTVYNISRQVMGIILVLLGQGLQFNVSPDSLSESVCAADSTNSSKLPCLLENNPDLRNSSNLDRSAEFPQDFTHALLLYDGLAVAVLFLLVVAFRPKFKRLEMERRATLLAKLQHETTTPNTSLPSTHAERVVASRGNESSQNRISSISTKL